MQTGKWKDAMLQQPKYEKVQPLSVEFMQVMIGVGWGGGKSTFLVAINRFTIKYVLYSGNV